MIVHIYYNKEYTSNRDRWVMIVDNIRELIEDFKIDTTVWSDTCTTDLGTYHCITLLANHINRNNPTIQIS